MGQITREILVNCQPDRVWRLLEKHQEHPEVSPIQQDPGDIQQVRGEALTTERKGIGTKTRWHYRYGGKPFVWDDVVTVWETGRRIAWRATSAWDMEDSFTLARGGDGTRVTYKMKYRLPYGPFGAVYGKLVLEPKMRKHLEQVLGRMKKLCEEPLSLGAGA